MNKCLSLAFVSFAALVHAQPQTMNEAQAQFARGEQHAARHDWALALADFQSVHAYLETVQQPRRVLVVYDIAVCLDELHRDSEAITEYRRFLAQAPPNAEERPEAERRLRELLARAALAGGSGGLSLSPIGIVLGATGLAAVIAGAIAGGFALDDRSRIQRMCTPEGHCASSLLGLANETQLLGGLADGLLFGGLALAAVGTVLAFVLGERASAVMPTAMIGRDCAMVVVVGLL